MVLPEKIGRYVIKSELGRGGMATVYRAYDPSFDREVAIKVLPREMLHDPQFRSRFEREIKMVAGLEHPSIVPVYDVGDEDGQPYFVMRYMTGGSLSDQIAKGNFNVQDTARIVEKIAKGLAYAHKKGIVHRDLKPDNILFDNNDDPFISDFGVAKLTEATGGLTGSGVIGTPAYMSPEQAQGNEIDLRSDVYGLGVIIYQMLSGQQPYSADTPMGVVVKHITDPVPEILNVLPSLPIEVDALIKTALAKNKTDRYANTIDMAKALNLAAFGNEGNISFGTNPGLRTGVPTMAPASPARGKMGLIVGGIILLLVLAVGGILLGKQLTSPKEPVAPASTVATAAPVLETAGSSSSFAPACGPDVLLPPLPGLKQTNSTCTKKSPYVTIVIPDGATFEPLNPDASCQSQMTGDGKTILICTGPNFLEYDLKVCAPPPPSSSNDLNQCPQDAIFDSANQCCVAAPPGVGPGCTLFKVKLKGC